jgi:hypothetical protein
MSGAANIFLNQTIYQDLNGLAFDAIVSFGRQGTWTPLNATVVSSDIERLVSGNYLFTATLQVKSELDTALVIPAYAGGRDLEVAPARIVVRVLMNPSKTQVVGEAVYVVERVSK